PCSVTLTLTLSSATPSLHDALPIFLLLLKGVYDQTNMPYHISVIHLSDLDVSGFAYKIHQNMYHQLCSFCREFFSFDKQQQEYHSFSSPYYPKMLELTDPDHTYLLLQVQR